jgi:membrane-associated phospholipid phosphatase
LTGLFLAWYKKTFYIFLPFVVIMNISRIAWWIHWFFDIIAWVIIWFISGVIVFKYLKINTKIDKLTMLIIKFFNSLKL